MLAVLLCEKFGWTWQEYNEQPCFFIDAIVEKMKAESSQAERQERKSDLMGRVKGRIKAGRTQ